MKLTKATLQNVVIDKPEPTIKSKQHTCLDNSFYLWMDYLQEGSTFRISSK